MTKDQEDTGIRIQYFVKQGMKLLIGLVRYSVKRDMRVSVGKFSSVLQLEQSTEHC